MGAGQIKDCTGKDRADQADDLVVRADGDKETDGQVGGCKKKGGEIAGAHRPPVQGADKGNRCR